MENVMMISRHRQWRAWQFGQRHSGLFGGGSSSGGTGGDDAPDWVFVAVVAYVVVMLVMMFVWPAAAGYMLAVLFLAGILGWVLEIFF